MLPLSLMNQYRTKTKVPYVVAIEGEGLGSGKTLSLVLLAALASLDKFKIYTNMNSLKLPHKDFYDEVLPFLDSYLAGDLDMPDHAFYLLDDINRFAESRKTGSNKLPVDLSHYMQGIRHTRSIFAYSLPDLMWTDVRFYDVTDMAIVATYDEVTHTVFWTMWDPQATERSSHRIIINRISFNAEALFPLYDTYEEIRRPSQARTFGNGSSYGREVTCKYCPSTRVRTNKEGIRHCEVCGNSWKVDVKRVES